MVNCQLLIVNERPLVYEPWHSAFALALALFCPDTFYRVGQRCFNGLETHRD